MWSRKELRKPEKASLICSLLRRSLPGESGQIVRDLSALVQDEKLVRQEAARLGGLSQQEQLHPHPNKWALLTHYNNLEGNRFFDPQDKLSFVFDRLCGVTSKTRRQGVMRGEGELWREALHKGLTAYVSCHFPVGTCRVFKKGLGKRQMFVACIEAHQYQPSNHWNSLWKSGWTFALTPITTQVTGIFPLRVHYFKDANLHVTISKSVSETLNVVDQSQCATDFVKLMKAEGTKFHVAILENIQALSEDIWGKKSAEETPCYLHFYELE